MKGELWIRNKPYYHYEAYNTHDEAYKIAKKYKRRNKSKYFIVASEDGPFNIKKFHLYLTKVYRLF